MKVNYKSILTVDSSQYISNPGQKEKDLYEYQTIDGKKELVKNGSKTSVYDLIQSHRLETDINNIITRFLNGDSEVLCRTKGTYGDFTIMPKTYAELYSRLQECENIFNSLPVDIKKDFDFSASKFWSEYGNDHFNEVFKKLFVDKEGVKEVVKEGDDK